MRDASLYKVKIFRRPDGKAGIAIYEDHFASHHINTGVQFCDMFLNLSPFFSFDITKELIEKMDATRLLDGIKMLEKEYWDVVQENNDLKFVYECMSHAYHQKTRTDNNLVADIEAILNDEYMGGETTE